MQGIEVSVEKKDKKPMRTLNTSIDKDDAKGLGVGDKVQIVVVGEISRVGKRFDDKEQVDIGLDDIKVKAIKVSAKKEEKDLNVMSKDEMKDMDIDELKEKINKQTDEK